MSASGPSSMMEVTDGSHILLKNVSELLVSEMYSDITFIVEGKKCNAHKAILAAQSPYFQAMLYGNLKESSLKEIELKEISACAFEAVLKYIYGGQLTFGILMKDGEIVEILKLSQLYALTELEDTAFQFLINNINVDNFFMIFEAARKFQSQRDDLIKHCYEFLEQNAEKVLQYYKFTELSEPAATDILSRVSLSKEVVKFQSIKDWLIPNPDTDGKQLLKLVDLNLMTWYELVHIVRPTKLFSSEEILNAVTVSLENSKSLPDKEGKERDNVDKGKVKRKSRNQSSKKY